MPNDSVLAQKIRTTAWIGIWVSTAAMLLIIVASAYFVWMSVADTETFAHEVQLELDLTGATPEISPQQALLVTAIWLVTYAVGLALLWTARSMFFGILNEGIFTFHTAHRIRRCGLLSLALFPVSTLIIGIETALITYWSPALETALVVVIDEADIYLVLLGLVVMALGHIMINAVQISDENKAFV